MNAKLINKMCKTKFCKFKVIFVTLVNFTLLLNLAFAEVLPSWQDGKAYKPNPILFLHGFALGSSESWDEFIFGSNSNVKKFDGIGKYFYNSYPNNSNPKYHLTLSFLERIDFFDPNGSVDTYDSGKYNPQGNSDGWADKLKIKVEDVLNKYKFNNSSLKINLICHSMGGLAIREFATNPKYGNLYLNIDKIITIGTPHAGTPLANINKVKDVVLSTNKYVWEVPYFGKTKVLAEISTTGIIVKNVTDGGIDFNGEALKDMAINSMFLKNLKNRTFPLNIKKFAIYGIGTTDTDIRLNKTFFETYYPNEPFLSGDGIVPRDSQKGYDIMSDFPYTSFWVWRPDGIYEVPADHFDQLKSAETIYDTILILDSTKPEFTLDSPIAGSMTEISSNVLTVKGRVYKEYLPADSVLHVKIVNSVTGALISDNDLPDSIKPSNLWIPNNEASPVAEFSQNISLPGAGTYQVSLWVRNPAGLTSEIKQFTVKVTIPTGSAYLVIHCHNPEGKEIESIQGVDPNSLQVYDNNGIIFGDYSANSIQDINKPIAISAGTYSMIALFNGMTQQNTVTLVPGETKTITFVFQRTDYNLTSWIDSFGINKTLQSSFSGNGPIHQEDNYSWTPFFYINVGGWAAGYDFGVDSTWWNCNASLRLNGKEFLAFWSVNGDDSYLYGFSYWASFVINGSQNNINPYMNASVAIPSNTSFTNWYVQSMQNGYYPVMIIKSTNSSFGTYIAGDYSLPYSGLYKIINLNTTYSYSQAAFTFMGELGGKLVGSFNYDSPIIGLEGTKEGSISGTILLKMSSVPYDLTGSGI